MGGSFGELALEQQLKADDRAHEVVRRPPCLQPLPDSSEFLFIGFALRNDHGKRNLVILRNWVEEASVSCPMAFSPGHWVRAWEVICSNLPSGWSPLFDEITGF